MDDLKEQLSAAEAFEREEVARAFRQVFATASGKRVLFWMLEQCAIYQDAFAGEATSATNYTLGLQSAGRRLIGKLDEIDPRYYPELLLAISNMKAIDAAAENRTANHESEDSDVEA